MVSPALKNSNWAHDQALAVIKRGGVVVMPTDTLYGIVASALLPEAVERVFTLRKRDLHKPVIVLIADRSDLDRFSVKPAASLNQFLDTVWPGAVSVVLPVEGAGFDHLHRGTRTIAFRLPSDESLRAFLRQSGPLIAPSANRAEEPAATTITEAKNFFGDTVDCYIDGGKKEGAPSTLVRWTPESITILRQGAIKLDTLII